MFPCRIRCRYILSGQSCQVPFRQLFVYIFGEPVPADEKRTSSRLNLAGRSCVRVGMCRSPMTSTRTILGKVTRCVEQVE